MIYFREECTNPISFVRVFPSREDSCYAQVGDNENLRIGEMGITFLSISDFRFPNVSNLTRKKRTVSEAVSKNGARKEIVLL